MPLHVEIGVNKKHKKSINLNTYRNMNSFVENKVKNKYQDLAMQSLFYLKNKKLPFIEIDFVLYKSSKRKIDKANFLSIHEKYFCDALTKLQIIEDDNDDYIGTTRYFNGGVDKENPRVEIFIYY
jgi:Holliday junction resolvase RusA-like endonuclease